MHFQFPKPINQFLIKSFAVLYKININEAEFPIADYLSIGDFFIRRLKVGSRPIAKYDYVHPADAMMTARGLIIGQQLIQAKGSTYPLSSFLQESSVDRWSKGFFITYYLCPTDYHRVHSPVDGFIKEVRYVPGNLWPVNEWSVSNISELFVKNERVIIEIQTEKGPIAVVLVGATNVGSIRLAFEPSLKSNHEHKRISRKITYLEPIRIQRGDELGLFAMGSTVIVIASSTWTELKAITQTHEPVQTQVGASTEIVY